MDKRILWRQPERLVAAVEHATALGAAQRAQLAEQVLRLLHLHGRLMQRHEAAAGIIGFDGSLHSFAWHVAAGVGEAYPNTPMQQGRTVMTGGLIFHPDRAPDGTPLRLDGTLVPGEWMIHT